MKKVKMELTVEVPQWARWLAIDCDGEVYIYAEKPLFDEHFKSWFNNTVEVANAAWSYLTSVGDQYDYSADSLQELPHE